MKRCALLLFVVLVFGAAPGWAGELPSGFVYLSDVDPTIVQEMRYFGYHNFLGRPVDGYGAPECILKEEAARDLKIVQDELRAMSMSLKVYDCYRPQRAVDDFVQWSGKPEEQATKAEFYPNVNKADFFKLGYVAKKSSHSKGVAVDLTIVPLPVPDQPDYVPGQPLEACTSPAELRFPDNTLDMGTSFDCLDPQSHTFSDAIPEAARKNRLLLRDLMLSHNFDPYDKEWWHFSHTSGGPDRYDFPITPK